jgi:hypothetical protein
MDQFAAVGLNLQPYTRYVPHWSHFVTVPCKNLIQSVLLQKTGTPVFLQ